MYFIPKYILVLGFTIVVDYFAGILIENAQGARRRWCLGLSIAANVGVLGLFKYFNFFNENIASIARFIGWNYPIGALTLALPVGLSFHTFQAMSYTIEVYRGTQPAERHFGIYALYVMFFPQLVAGPIERPQNLLHQFREVHQFDYERITSGLKLIAWGLFKKTVVADRLALFVNQVYPDPAQFSGPILALATVAFAFQVYGDFSGYSDVAVGSARVLGFRLMQNFDRPYSARSVGDYWRRWHISLMSWFRDYLFYPLAITFGRWRIPAFGAGAATLVVFLTSGLWHGASWHYVAWGGLHGFYLVFGMLTRRRREQFARWAGVDVTRPLYRLLQLLCTFFLVCIGMVLFRTASLSSAWLVLRRCLTGWGNLLHPGHLASQLEPALLAWVPLGFIAVIVMEMVEAWRVRPGAVSALGARPWWFRWGLYYGMASVLFFLHTAEPAQFIYFQF
jgi:D-alanyl-lipoteichoic acid acyltransferase DltB (MBOAT superfamily)